MERACVTLATGVSGNVSRTAEKDKETLKSVLVEKSERTDAKDVQSVNWEARASECRSRRVWIGKSKAASENKTYDGIVIISLLRILLIKSKHHYLSFPLRPIKILQNCLPPLVGLCWPQQSVQGWYVHPGYDRRSGIAFRASYPERQPGYAARGPAAGLPRRWEWSPPLLCKAICRLTARSRWASSRV